jgi:hypothetical protein
MVILCARIRQATAARRVCSCETDCPPLDPTPSPSELAIRSRLRWPASAIVWTAVTAAGMSTGNKMIKRTIAIENMGVLSFLRQGGSVSFREASRGKIRSARGIRMMGPAETGSPTVPSRVLPFPDTVLTFPDTRESLRIALTERGCASHVQRIGGSASTSCTPLKGAHLTGTCQTFFH